MKRFALSMIFLFGAGSASAVDGVLEINQLCVANGCFAGDSGGFPVQLTSNGSYRLTSNLTVTSANTTAILATADLVTVDLNGFTIIGPVNCSGGPPVTGCNFSTGTGNGVHLNASTNSSGSTVKNGLIQGMGDSGVKCLNCTVINVSSRSNRMTGFIMTGGSIFGSSAIANGDIGIFGTGSLLKDIRSSANKSAGIRCDSCSILDSIVSNETVGIVFEGNSVWGRNLLYSNSANTNTFSAPTAVNPNRCGGTAC